MLSGFGASRPKDLRHSIPHGRSTMRRLGKPREETRERRAEQVGKQTKVSAGPTISPEPGEQRLACQSHFAHGLFAAEIISRRELTL
jgi:hypothetical protein